MCKNKTWTIFHKLKSMSECWKMKNRYAEIKPMPWIHFQHIIMIRFKNVVKKFSSAFPCLCDTSRNLLKEFEPKSMIFSKNWNLCLSVSKVVFVKLSLQRSNVPKYPRSRYYLILIISYVFNGLIINFVSKKVIQIQILIFCNQPSPFEKQQEAQQ